jgi:hypothetical protein
MSSTQKLIINVQIVLHKCLQHKLIVLGSPIEKIERLKSGKHADHGIWHAFADICLYGLVSPFFGVKNLPSKSVKVFSKYFYKHRDYLYSLLEFT